LAVSFTSIFHFFGRSSPVRELVPSYHSPRLWTKLTASDSNYSRWTWRNFTSNFVSLSDINKNDQWQMWQVAAAQSGLVFVISVSSKAADTAPSRDDAAISRSLTVAEAGQRPPGNGRCGGGGGTGSPPWWKQEPKNDGLCPRRVSPSSGPVGGGGQQDSGDGAPAETVTGGKRVVGGGGCPNSDRQTKCRAGYDNTQHPSQRQRDTTSTTIYTQMDVGFKFRYSSTRIFAVGIFYCCRLIITPTLDTDIFIKITNKTTLLYIICLTLTVMFSKQ